MSHDPDNKVVLPKNVQFRGVKIKSCLTKEYPDEGDYAGGIVFKRCYGMGQGVGFTREQCEKMWSDVNLDDHTMIVHTGAADEDTGAAGAAGEECAVAVAGTGAADT